MQDPLYMDLFASNFMGNPIGLKGLYQVGLSINRLLQTYRLLQS